VPGSLFDTSVWIAALFPTHPFYAPARQALLGAAPGDPAVLCRSTQQSFLRLVSAPALSKAYGAEGLTNGDALAALDALLALPQVCERAERPGTVAIWRRLASRDTASPKVWMDAYLTAFAMGGRTAPGFPGPRFPDLRSSGARSGLARRLTGIRNGKPVVRFDSAEDAEKVTDDSERQHVAHHRLRFAMHCGRAWLLAAFRNP
jgi:uncharacterized protein